MKSFGVPSIIALFATAGFLIGEELPTTVKTPSGLSGSDWSGIREAYEQNRHAIVNSPDGTHQARNPGQAWLTRFDGRAFTVSPDHGDWSWGLELKSYGYAGHDLKISGSPEVKVAGGRLEYQHDKNLNEWFVNDSRGLEQGWTLQHRPAGAEAGGMLKLEIALHGGLQARVASGEAAVSFVDASGANVIQYSDLKAWDADGKSIAVNFEPGEDGFHVVANDAGARYPITIDPIAQQTYLKASNTEEDDNFGSSIAVSGDTVVVGALGENSKSLGVNGNENNPVATYSGAAYVFVRVGNTWTQQAYLKASNTQENDYFGDTVSISGDTIVVGAPNESSSATGVNGDQSDDSAYRAGAAYVFVRSGTAWSQQAYIKASNTGYGNGFGGSVSVSGDLLVVGASGEYGISTGVNGSQSQNIDHRRYTRGAAYVFARSGTIWSQEAYLKASNTGSDDRFGGAVAISGETVVIGATGEDSGASGVDGNQLDNDSFEAGAAYVFARNGGIWSQQAYLKASNPDSADYFGVSVAVSGDTVAVGANWEDGGATGANGVANNLKSESGAVYVFARSSNTWSQQAYVKASNTDAGDGFGVSVALSGDQLVVGADGEGSRGKGIDSEQTDNTAAKSGAAYVYKRAGGIWSQQSYLKASNTEAGDEFGSAVGASGGTVVVGARGESSISTGFNGDQADNSAPASGAAYVFDTTYTLAVSSTHGTISGAGDYFVRDSATVAATPDAGYVFSNWTGAATGSSNPLSVFMDSNKTIGADFIPDTRDPDADGLDNYTEIVVQGTDPNVPDTDGDGYSDGYEVSFSSDPKSMISVPTFTLTLVNDGSATGGNFTRSGSLAHGKNAIITATSLPGYVFDTWTNDSTAGSNPLTLLMDSNKTIGAKFKADTGDADGDGLDNYTELVILGTRPDRADTDGDGLGDGAEITGKTNPLKFDTDSDGLGDGLEKKIGTNPLLVDSDKNGRSDAEEDRDRDGVSNGLEVKLGTNPKKADSDGDGLTDGFEVALVGKTAPFAPRAGDRIRLDFNRLGFSGTMRLAGKLPRGLHFDPVKKVLGGTLVGQPGRYSLSLQLFEGRKFIRNIPIPFRVGAFPGGLAGRYEALLENPESGAIGKVAVTIRAPGKDPSSKPAWSATLDVAGSGKMRKTTGGLVLNPNENSTNLRLSFPATDGLKTVVVTLGIDAGSELVEGDFTKLNPRSSGVVRGFRLVRQTRLAHDFTMVIDQGERDGFSIPAGMGWAIGSLAKTGGISISGQLGDSQEFKTTARLSTTGQAIVWVKPYRNVNSWMGGIISIRDNTLVRIDSGSYQIPGLSWFRASDESELSYPQGFGPIRAESGIASYSVPANAGALATSLGLKGRTFGHVLIEGGGLPDPRGSAVLPEVFVLRDDFELAARPVSGGANVPWKGSIAKGDGTFSATLKLPASSFGVSEGRARVRGVLIPGAGFGGVVGAGLVEIPINDKKGAFRTAAILISQ